MATRAQNDALNNQAAALLEQWHRDKREKVTKAISELPPLAAAYVSAYITQYLSEDGESDGRDTSGAFLDALLRGFNLYG